jgi:uncharacterized protein YjbJ (UPF0337 family)
MNGEITGSGAPGTFRRARTGAGEVPAPKEEQMGFVDKLKNRFQMAKGHGKQKAGHAAGDPGLEASGERDRVAGGTKQVGEQVKDAGKNVRDTFKG